MKFVSPFLALLLSVLGLGQNATVTLTGSSCLLQLAGKGLDGQILLSANDWWCVIRVAEDLAGDFGNITGKNLMLVNCVSGKSNTQNIMKRDGEWKRKEKRPKGGQHYGENSNGGGRTVLYMYNPP